MTNGDRGFTLAESMVALLILGVALVPLSGALADGLAVRQRVDGQLEAVALAEARMNELALLPPDSVAAWLRPREGGHPAPLEGYRWRALLRPLPESPALYQAAVLVRWPGGSYALETVLRIPPDAEAIR